MPERMTPQRYRRNAGWLRAADTKIERCGKEFGFGTINDLRCGRGRMRCALSLLQKAAHELGQVEHPTPCVREVHTRVGTLVLACESALLAMDEAIAEVANRPPHPKTAGEQDV